MSTGRCLIRKPTDLNGIGGLNVQDGSEASVEEILDSIKKVIARDNRAGALEARRMRSRSTREDAAPAPRDPVLEEEAEDVYDLADADLAEEEERASREADGSADSVESLLSEAARNSMRDNLATLALLSEPGASPQIVRSGETSLEGMVREMLRPMLAEWLDTNLPPMVEDLVRQEIAQIVQKKR